MEMIAMQPPRQVLSDFLYDTQLKLVLADGAEPKMHT